MRVAAGAIARKIIDKVLIRGALVQMGPHEIDRANWDWDEVLKNPVLLPRCQGGGIFRDLSRFHPQGGVLHRRRHRDRGRKRAAGLGRANLWQARRGIGERSYVDQRGQGRRDRRRFRRRGTFGRSQRRRDPPRQRRRAAVLVEPRGRNTRRDLHRPAGRRAFRGQAHLLNSDTAPDHRSFRRRDRNRDKRPPRSLRWNPRRSGRRSHGCLRARRSVLAPSRASRRKREIGRLRRKCERFADVWTGNFALWRFPVVRPRPCGKILRGLRPRSSHSACADGGGVPGGLECSRRQRRRDGRDGRLVDPARRHRRMVGLVPARERRKFSAQSLGSGSAARARCGGRTESPAFPSAMGPRGCSGGRRCAPA